MRTHRTEQILFICTLFLFIYAESYEFPWHIEHWLKPESRIASHCKISNRVANHLCEIEQSEESSYVDVLSQNVFPLLKTIVEIEDFHPTRISSEHKAILNRLYSKTHPEHLLNEILSPFFISSEIPCLLSWIDSQSPHITHPYNLSLILPYLEKSCSFLSTLQTNIPSQNHSHVRVLIVGGGPAGLMSAISAYSEGAKVEVHEKRGEYRRDTWFDLEPKPWSTSRETLESSWGLGFQKLEHVVHDAPVITVRTQNLERFLSKLIVILDIPIFYHSEFITFCNQSNQYHAIFYNTSNPQQIDPPSNWCDSQITDNSLFHKTEFDLIVGCDGFSSRVRNASNIDFPIQDTFDFVNRSIREENLHQSSMIVNFLPLPTGECPHLKYDDDGYIIDPRLPSFFVHGVTSVWKRFYKNYCQLQILFTHNVGTAIVNKYENLVPKKQESLFWKDKQRQDELDFTWQNEAIPWQKLKSITNLLFVEPPSNVSSLEKMIARRRYDDRLFDIEIVNVRIHKASENTKILFNNGSSSVIATLSGDSSVTAHYRLGVGINNAFLALNEFSALVRNLKNSATSAELLVLEKNELANKRASRLVQFELSTMFYESFCDYSIYFDRSLENYWETQILYRKDMKLHRFIQMNQEQIVQYCNHLQIKLGS